MYIFEKLVISTFQICCPFSRQKFSIGALTPRNFPKKLTKKTQRNEFYSLNKGIQSSFFIPLLSTIYKLSKNIYMSYGMAIL